MDDEMKPAVEYRTIDWINGVDPERYRIGRDKSIWRNQSGRWRRLKPFLHHGSLLTVLQKRSGAYIQIRISTLFGNAFAESIGRVVSPFESHLRADNKGQIWSKPQQHGKWTLLIPQVRHGYSMVRFTDPRTGKRIFQSVARLVLRAFGIPQPIGCVPYCFPDRNPLNCALDNLRWAPVGTSQLGRHAPPKAFISGHQGMIGEAHPLATITESQVLEMRCLLSNGWTQREVADEFDLPISTVSGACNGATWKHLPGALTIRSGAHTPKGIFHMSAKLDDEKVILCRQRFRNGEQISQLAREMGITHQAMQAVVRRRTWKHVPD